jgi:kynureninase
MSLQNFEPNLDFARRLDGGDVLAEFRDKFVITDPDLIYADGNSLGRLPKASAECIETTVRREWGDRLIRGWNAGWFDSAARVGDKIGQLIGAGPGRVVVSDTTSINLFKLTMAALSLRPERSRIISDVLNFPSDLYILQGCIDLLGNRHHLDLIPSDDGLTVDMQTLYDTIDEKTALVTLSQVVFKSAYLYDVEAVTRKAHEAGALVLWDMSHSAGVVPAELDRWNVDLAVGCTYKYLNGGPGAPAFLYVRPDLQDKTVQPIWGWFGQKRPFDFGLDYDPADGIKRFLVSSPPILSLSAMEASIDILLEAGIDRIRAKSTDLTAYLIFLCDTRLKPLGFELGTPRDPERRGSHISLQHREAYRINRALIDEMNVIPDFREPNIIRLGLSPLYNSFADVWGMVERIRIVVEEKRYLNYPTDRPAVT